MLGGRCQALGGGEDGGGQGGRCRNERWVLTAAGGVFPALKGQEDGQRPQGEGAGTGVPPGAGPGAGGPAPVGAGREDSARRRSGAGQPGGGTRKGAFDSPPLRPARRRRRFGSWRGGAGIRANLAPRLPGRQPTWSVSWPGTLPGSALRRRSGSLCACHRFRDPLAF